MGIYLNFQRGTKGASSAHAMYISRESAVLDREDGIVMRNMPEEIEQSKNYNELRTNLGSYAWMREEQEIANHKSKGEPRTHFKTTISFDENIENKKAKIMVNEWLDHNFNKSRAIGFIHRDTEHTHVHIWIDSRQVDGKKIDLKPSQYRNLDTQWNRIYSREMGRNEKEHINKKTETEQYKKGQIQEKPIRSNNFNKDIYRQREVNNYTYGIEKERFGRYKRDLTTKNSREGERDYIPKPGEQRANKQTDRKHGREDEIREQLNRTTNEARGLRQGIEGLRERIRTVYREKEIDKIRNR